MIAGKVAIEESLEAVTALVKTIFKEVVTSHSGLVMLDGNVTATSLKDGATIFKNITFPTEEINGRSIEQALFTVLREPSRIQTDETGSGDGSTSGTLFGISTVDGLNTDDEATSKYDEYTRIFTVDRIVQHINDAQIEELLEAYDEAPEIVIPVAERSALIKSLVAECVHKKVKELGLTVDIENDPVMARELMMKTAHTACGDYGVSEKLCDAFFAGGKNTYVDLVISSDSEDRVEEPKMKFIHKDLHLLTKNVLNDRRNVAYTYSRKDAPALVIKGRLEEEHLTFIATAAEELAKTNEMIPLTIFCYGTTVAVKAAIDQLNIETPHCPALLIGYISPSKDASYNVLDDLSTYIDCHPIEDLNVIDSESDDYLMESDAGFGMHLGTVNSLVLGNTRTIVSNTLTESGNNNRFNALIESLKGLISDGEVGQEEKANIIGGYKLRLSMLQGSDVKLYIGGETYAVKQTRNYLAEDALRALSTILESGCTTGYLSSYVYVLDDKVTSINMDELPINVIKILHRLTKGVTKAAVNIIEADPDAVADVERMYANVDLSYMESCRFSKVSRVQEVVEANLIESAAIVLMNNLRELLLTSLEIFITEYIGGKELFEDARGGIVTDLISGLKTKSIKASGIQIKDLDVLDTQLTQKIIIDTGLSIMNTIFSTHIFLSSREPGKVEVEELKEYYK